MFNRNQGQGYKARRLGGWKAVKRSEGNDKEI